MTQFSNNPEDPIISENIPTFDDSRIRDTPDKLLLARIKTYFKAFTTKDFQAMSDLYAEDYKMTDTPLCVVRFPKARWNEANMGFSNLLTDLHVQAISLHGSSAPGQFAILEQAVWFTLSEDPPEAAKPNLPPGIVKGDRAGMSVLGVFWWNEQGKLVQELEYGRLTWEGFDVAEFDK